MRALNGEQHRAASPAPLHDTHTPNVLLLIEERLALLEAEGLGATAWDTLYAGCAYSRSVGDKAAAGAWARRAADTACIALGGDSAEVEKYTSACTGGRRAATPKHRQKGGA